LAPVCAAKGLPILGDFLPFWLQRCRSSVEFVTALSLAAWPSPLADYLSGHSELLIPGLVVDKWLRVVVRAY